MIKAPPAVDIESIAARLSLIRPHLDERAWRLLLGAEAKVLGRGGIKLVATAAGVHPATVAQGLRELDCEEPIPGRVRRPGAGRPPMTVTKPDLLVALDALVDPVARGDRESPLRWTTKSTAKLAAELTANGHRVSARTVAKLLKLAGYSLQGNSKSLEGDQHPDRDAQFAYLNTYVERFQADGDAVISVDVKKKELVGNFTAAGRKWESVGSLRRVRVHGLAHQQVGKVPPDGVYDIGPTAGWVDVGTDADTGQFAVESIRRWWATIGALSCPGSAKLLITADFGGSNGSRLELWKAGLAAFAAEAGFDITVCHLPSGTSKWSKIDHRLLSAISRGQRRRPLESHEVVIETVGTVGTTEHFTEPPKDATTYVNGVKIANTQIANLEATQLRRHEFHGDWNYTLTADDAATHTRPSI